MANSKHSTNFFLEVSSFTRHLLDDILPVEVCKQPNISSEILENLCKECDALILSLQNFKARTITSGVNETATLLNVLEIEDNVQFNKLCEYILENVVAISDIIKCKPFYCKLCNLTTWQENVINEHCTSSKHVEQTNQVLEPVTVFKCKQCYLVLIAKESEINSIKLLSNHCKLDKHIKKLKESNDKELGKSESYSKQNFTGSNNDPSKTVSNAPKLVNVEENGTQISIKNKTKSVPSPGINVNANDVTGTAINVTKLVVPKKVTQAMKLFRKKLKVDGRVPDIVLHFCDVCDVAVTSIACYIQHNSSKQHISAVNNAANPIHLFKCDTCKLLITGYPPVIHSIITSDLHKEIDEYVNSLKTAPVKKQSTPITKKVQSCVDSKVKTNSCTIQQSSEQIPIPYDLKHSLIFIFEKVKKATDLKKCSLAYCFVCERNVDSFNNFQQHMKSKQHKLLCSTITQSLCFHQCSVCLISVFGTDHEVNNTIKSNEHIKLDEKVKNLFKNNISNNLENIPNDIKISKEKLCSLAKVPKVNTSPKVKTTSDNPKLSTSPEMNSIPSTSTNNNAIPTNFFTFNAALLNGSYKKTGFCRICNKGIIIKHGWALHINCKKHITKTIESDKNLIPARCKLCPFQILGDQPYDNVCFNLHMKLNHPDGIADSNQTSAISSQQYLNSNIIGNDVDNLIPNLLETTNGDDVKEIQDNSCSQSIPLDKKNTQHSVVSSTESNNLNMDVFIKFLKKKKTIFLDQGLKQFGGICLICSMIFEDYYIWLIHVKGTAHKETDRTNIYERECETCNLSLFGDRSLIDDEFWPLEEHLSLDTLISQ